MSGHSKWNNIKRKKEKTDGQRAKIFTKMGREITVAVREGGPDPLSNGKLRDVIAKAKANNVPSDNIDRIVKKAQGADKADYENIVYEGYGPGGVAVIVETLTENRNRTAADVRHYFDKYGGNLGTSGCVSFMFEQKGVIVIDTDDLDEDRVMEDSLECGADDAVFEDGAAEIITSPALLREVRENLEAKGYTFASAEVEYVPSNYTRLEGEENLKKMGLLLEHLEDNDDVQDVWHNLENEEDLPE
ncbi:MAG: YebC/PmpR family DNA-binding transcriptional regulator [Oscillospiraceae bacterium]